MAHRTRRQIAFALAVTVGYVVQFALSFVVAYGMARLPGANVVQTIVSPDGNQFRVMAMSPWYRPVPYAVPIVAIGLAVFVYGWLSQVRSGEHETRCRRCQYILRGLSEPRCPECGTSI